MSKLIFVDCEATGLSPYSGVLTEFGAVEYKSKQSFHGVLWESEPDPDNPAKPLIKGKQYSELDVFRRFEQWLNRFKDRPIFISDNPAYDWQWISFYFDKTLGRNPFGHSARRISDFWAGLQGNFHDSQSWKRYRVTPHDHNPVHDSLGNVEAFEYMMRLTGKEI